MSVQKYLHIAESYACILPLNICVNTFTTYELFDFFLEHAQHQNCQNMSLYHHQHKMQSKKY